MLVNTHAKFEEHPINLTGRNLCPQIQKRNKNFLFFFLFSYFEKVNAYLYLEGDSE